MPGCNSMPGQVFALGGRNNDADLVRLRYIEPVEGKPRLATCGICGAQFLDDTGATGTDASATVGRTTRPVGVPAGKGWPMRTAAGPPRTAPTRRRYGGRYDLDLRPGISGATGRNPLADRRHRSRPTRCSRMKRLPACSRGAEHLPRRGVYRPPDRAPICPASHHRHCHRSPDQPERPRQTVL